MQAALEAPFGSVRVHVDDEARVTRVELSPQDHGWSVPEGFPSSVERAFEAYLDGARQAPVELPVASLDVTAFQARVLEALAEITPARTVTYGELAERIGSPGAARAVGGALARNPVPLVRPCHRVIATDGLGGFGGCPPGSEADALGVKRWLLEHEDAARA